MKKFVRFYNILIIMSAMIGYMIGDYRGIMLFGGAFASSGLVGILVKHTINQVGYKTVNFYEGSEIYARIFDVVVICVGIGIMIWAYFFFDN